MFLKRCDAVDREDENAQRLVFFGLEAAMTDKPLKWPYTAAAERDAALEAALDGLHKLDGLRRLLAGKEERDLVWEIERKLNLIKDCMVSAGAPYRPV